MLTILHDMVQGLNLSYLVIDGLDECQDLSTLMTFLCDFEASYGPNPKRNCRWFISSQDVLTISQNLLADCFITGMDKALVDADIESYVLSRLDSDPQLRNYSTEKKTLISEALSSRSQGM
jgi:hypothetical protein